MKTETTNDDIKLVREFIRRELFNKGETPAECEEMLAFDRIAEYAWRYDDMRNS